MNDPIFRQMRDQMRPSPELVGRLGERLRAEPTAPDAPGASSGGFGAPAGGPGAAAPGPETGHLSPRRARRRQGRAGPAGRDQGPAPRRRIGLPLVSAAAVAAVALVGVVVYATVRGPSLTADPAAIQPADPVVAQPANYDAVYAALEGVWRQTDWEGSTAAGRESGLAVSGAADDYADSSGIELQPDYSSSSADDSFTSTNVQVEGIDEGDIVKTDGRTIFTVSDAQVVLVRADGAGSQELARIDTAPDLPELDPNSYVDSYWSISDILLHDDVLAVLVQRSRNPIQPAADETAEAELAWIPEKNDTLALLYDVADPGRPRLTTSLGQDGWYQTSRLADGKLYVVSNYWLADQAATDRDDPASYAPCLTKDGDTAVMAAADLAIWSDPTSAEYTVVSAIDVAGGKRISQQAVLGGTQTVYMSPQNLYLASTRWRAEPLTGLLAQIGIGSSSTTSVTELIRMSLGDGELAVAAEGAVAGSIVGQFALDEYESNLRVATTIGAWEGVGTRSSLFVLGPDLAPLGKIDSLVSGESVQSVRFAGPIGYVVTFLQTDPLFAIDLADPAAPQVLSALKITGFSSYLHPWGDGELIGLGYAGDEVGLTGALKLALFDVSDPRDVTLRDSWPVNYDDSDALFDHRAVLVDPSRGLIGFPVRSWDSVNGGTTMDYLVYGYDPAVGFEARRVFELPAAWSDQWVSVRGMRIGEFVYVASAAGLLVADAESLEQVRAIEYATASASAGGGAWRE
ncbi:MAG: beta-propeller domain-containing protein [Bifidobacteriaceae bacterium]|jgi:uncharacterized secreted protein with C-terminal beta-propeller domain|nr:beta-propeller domain-containing protein [Bifidobacteriaceae bacterium]